MTWLERLTPADWTSIALPLLALLLWLLERAYRRFWGESLAGQAQDRPLLSLSSGLSYAPDALSDDARHQRTNQAVQFLLHDQSQFIGADTPATALQLLDPKAPYDVLTGYIPADLIAFADTGYHLPTTAAVDPASLALTSVVQPAAPWLDDNLPGFSPRVKQVMRLFVAILMLAPLVYRIVFP